MILNLFWAIPATAEPPDAEEPPSRELLEFLGSFKDDDVGWVDPFVLPVDDDETGKAPSDEEDDQNRK